MTGPMRPFLAALILLFALSAAAQDMPSLFRQGVTAMQEKRYDTAIAACRKMLVADPSLVRVRLELARAFFMKGEDTLARRHFEQVLARKPPAGIALNINRFLNQIDAGAGWAKQRTERERERNSSRWLRVGATVQFPHGFTLGGAATLRWTGMRANGRPS